MVPATLLPASPARSSCAIPGAEETVNMGHLVGSCLRGGRAGRAVPICSAVGGWEATAMPVTEREIYRSSNGDQWYLVQERGSDRGYVRHQPNRASGGQSSLTDV